MNKIILDIDSVGDDILAVLYGLKHPEMDILGITTVVGASGDVDHATNIALKLVELSDSDVKVYKGEETPIGEEREIDGDPVNFFEEFEWKFGERLNRFNEGYGDYLDKAEKEHAVDFIVETINNNPNEINLVATGPLTNIAKALEKDPAIIDKVKHCYILGGTFKAPGNITPVVEYNIYADPEAASKVFTSGMRITLVPLDVCEYNEFATSMLTRDDLFDMKEYGSGKVIDYIVEKFPIYIDMWRAYFGLVGFPMDDVIALALVTDDHLCTYSDYLHLEVELNGELTRGQTIAYKGNQIIKNPNANVKNVRIAESIRGRAFIQLFKDVIMEKY